MKVFKNLAIKIATAVTTGVASVVLIAAPASAAASLSIDPTAARGVGGASVTLTGTVTCDSNYTGVMLLSLNQASGFNGNSNVAFGTTAVVCDGAPHAWSSTLPIGHLGPWQPGSAWAMAQLQTTDLITALIVSRSVTLQ